MPDCESADIKEVLPRVIKFERWGGLKTKQLYFHFLGQCERTEIDQQFSEV